MSKYSHAEPLTVYRIGEIVCLICVLLPLNTFKVISGAVINLTTLFLGKSPRQFSST